MARAHREVAPVTWVEVRLRRVALETLVAAVVKACADSLAEFPELNARLEGDDVVELDRYDIGVAVKTEQTSSCPWCAVSMLARCEIDAEIRSSPTALARGRSRPTRSAARRSR